MANPRFQVDGQANHMVQHYIDTSTLAAFDALSSPNGQPSITLKRRPKKAPFFINPENGALEASQEETSATYAWPGKDVYEAWKFTVTIRVLAAVAEAIEAELVISKRDIYYMDPACFGSQRVVDTTIDDISYTIGVNRAALNVEAAAKGLTAGCYTLTTRSGEVTDAQTYTKDALIPSSEDTDNIDISGVEWVLIVEKEAVFRRLARSSYHTRAAAGKGILVTGKGYPDICTRAFVRRIFNARSHSQDMPRFYVLVDSDPDGMAIMSTYKYGSMAHTHDNGRLNVPGLRWLGLRSSDAVVGSGAQGDDTFIPLSARDRRMAVTTLKNNPACATDGPEQEWRAELQRMLMLNLKAEIEILYDRGDLEEWIDQKMT